MAIRISTLIFIVISVLSGCSTPDEGQSFFYRSALIRALASPDALHGKRVQFFGYCRLEFEALALYLSKEDYEYALGKSVWLDIPLDGISPSMQKIEYCVVEGTFSASNHGHMGLHIGALERITLFESWPPRPK